ncbi:MAG: hypothetical protein JW941_07180 [Candidatus Coatesbacteria bacterium]|nr:hypothetical protein [Candidatus Coatesbacteria bacterium]
MIHENEMLRLLLGAGVLIFALINERSLRRLPHREFLMASFYTLLFAWIVTVAEGFLWPHFLDHLEHVCYPISAALLAIWSWRTFRTREGSS